MDQPFDSFNFQTPYNWSWVPYHFLHLNSWNIISLIFLLPEKLVLSGDVSRIIEIPPPPPPPNWAIIWQNNQALLNDEQKAEKLVTPFIPTRKTFSNRGLAGERLCESKVSFPRTQHNDPGLIVKKQLYRLNQAITSPSGKRTCTINAYICEIYLKSIT